MATPITVTNIVVGTQEYIFPAAPKWAAWRIEKEIVERYGSNLNLAPKWVRYLGFQLAQMFGSPHP
jgi:hypothetical protein